MMLCLVSFKNNMKIFVLLVVFLTFTNNAFANVNRMTFDIRRMADAQEKQNKILCDYIKLSNKEFKC